MRHHQTTEAPNKPYPASSGSNQHSSHSARQQKTAARAHGTVAAATRRTRAGEAARTPLLGCWRLELLRFCPSRPRPRAAEARPPDDESTTTAALLLLGCSHAPSLQRSCPGAPQPSPPAPPHRHALPASRLKRMVHFHVSSTAQGSLSRLLENPWVLQLISYTAPGHLNHCHLGLPFIEFLKKQVLHSQDGSVRLL
jgi:hypothetical protein